MIRGTVTATRDNPKTGEKQYQVEIEEEDGRIRRGGASQEDLVPDDDDAPYTQVDDAGAIGRGDASPGLAGLVMSRNEVAAVNRYTGAFYQDINSHLRGLASNTPRNTHLIEQVTDRVDAAIARNGLGSAEVYSQSQPGEVPVFRGTRLASFGIESVDDLKVGMDLQNHAFISTSSDPEQARKFADAASRGPGGSDSFVMKVNLQESSAALSARGLSRSPSEEEVVLGRKSRFRIKAIHEDHPAGRDPTGKSPPRLVVEVDHFNE